MAPKTPGEGSDIETRIDGLLEGHEIVTKSMIPEVVDWGIYDAGKRDLAKTVLQICDENDFELEPEFPTDIMVTIQSQQDTVRDGIPYFLLECTVRIFTSAGPKGFSCRILAPKDRSFVLGGEMPSA